MNKWTIHVRDFGKINKADITVSPLTFFVGDNNSGKSYIMTLLYGLLRLEVAFGNYRINYQSKNYKECMDCILRQIEKLDERKETLLFSVEGKELMLFQDLLNEILKDNKEKFLNNLFNYNVPIRELWLEFPKDAVYWYELSFTFIREKEFPGMLIRALDGQNNKLLGYGVPAQKKDERRFDFLLCYMLQKMLQMGFVKQEFQDILYLPTARTGYLLTYKTLMGEAVKEKFNFGEGEKNLLTRPNSDFLVVLSQMSGSKVTDQYDDVIQYMQKHMFKGKVMIDEQFPAGQIVYQPEGLNEIMPMYVASGVVTEMAPLLLALKYEKVGALLIEEPEISLHPALQKEIARVLVRLKNSGMSIFVTTHSDIIIQYINNMLKLQNSEDKESLCEKYQFDDLDRLTREEVEVYQFCIGNNGKTDVEKLSCGDYGFEAGTFYTALEELVHLGEEIEGLGEE